MTSWPHCMASNGERYLYTDPTEYPRQIEPTQAAYRNPYEATSLYYGEIPPAPPPPPKQRHMGLVVALVIALCLIVVLGGVLFAVMHVSFQQKVKGATKVTSVPAIIPTPATTPKPKMTKPTPTPGLTVVINGGNGVPNSVPTPTPILPTPTPTLAPTPTPTTPTVPHYANDIYNDFYASGYGGPDPHSVTWGCCTYNPAGGIVQWTDSRSGIWMQIATFYNNGDAEVDAGELYQQGYYSNVVNSCLLVYPKTFPTSVLSEYVQLMQTYCN
jgi:hypothetical protein